jgi:hypothetical protein
MDQKSTQRADFALAGVALLFFGLALALWLDLWGHPPEKRGIPLVDEAFLDTSSFRKSYADLVREGGDIDDFDCYLCHTRNQAQRLLYDDAHNLVIPPEHENIVMAHGSHDRNNLCFNCHNASNLEVFQTRDGRQLSFAESNDLCGSCHGPTFRDWEFGVHGRISGYWDRSLGDHHRLDCVSCHDPHSPSIPSRAPAPGPTPSRPVTRPNPTH